MQYANWRMKRPAPYFSSMIKKSWRSTAPCLMFIYCAQASLYSYCKKQKKKLCLKQQNKCIVILLPTAIIHVYTKQKIHSKECKLTLWFAATFNFLLHLSITRQRISSLVVSKSFSKFYKHNLIHRTPCCIWNKTQQHTYSDHNEILCSNKTKNFGFQINSSIKVISLQKAKASSTSH